jgi:hypothetical protein
MYIVFVLGVSILPLSTILIFDLEFFWIWNCSDSVVFLVFHFIINSSVKNPFGQIKLV